MNGMLKIKVAACVLVLTIISVGYIFADDVIVQEGDIQAVNLEAENIGATNLDADYIGVNYMPYAYLSDAFIDGVLCVNGTIGNSYVDTKIGGALIIHDGLELSYVAWEETAYIGGVSQIIMDDILWVCDPSAGGPLMFVDGDFLTSGYSEFGNDVEVDGIIYANGGVVNPYASSIYEQKSRDEIIEQVQKEVPPDKQNSAAMFFNKETKKIENYVASEGKFYDMQGNVVQELAEVVKPTTKYETVYHFDKTTGQIKSTQRAVSEEFQIKKEYSLDSKTGKFINKNTGQTVSREEALEIYASAEGKIYDLNHNFLRDADKKKSPEITPAGNFKGLNGSKSQIKTAQNNTENQEITVKPASSN